jgi:hypothetical protein
VIGIGSGAAFWISYTRLKTTQFGRSKLGSLDGNKQITASDVLQFIPDVTRTVAEMRRVVRPGGTVTAAVWDAYGGMLHSRLLWDIAAVLDPSIVRPLIRPLSKPNETSALWRELGFLDVEQASLLIRTEFSCFDDYWLPFTRGEGPPGQFVASLSDTARSALQEHVRRAYFSGLPDGPRSFACVAWACRGTVPT